MSFNLRACWMHLVALKKHLNVVGTKTCPNNLMGPIARHGQVQPKCININVMHPGTEYV